MNNTDVPGSTLPATTPSGSAQAAAEKALNMLDEMLATLEITAKLQQLQKEYWSGTTYYDLPVLEFKFDDYQMEAALVYCREMACVATSLIRRI